MSEIRTRGAAEPGMSALSGRRVCVTGGAGFIGSHLVDALLESGCQVSVIDDFSNGRDSNLAPASASWAREQLGIIRASILDDAALDQAFTGCDAVLHHAALGSVPESLERPERYQEVNAGGTLRVLQAARRNKVRRVIYAASSSAYGDSGSEPQREAARPDPRSPYAATKLAGEELLRSWSLSFGIETLSLRYFNVFGPRQRHDSAYAAVIPVWSEAVRAGRPAVIYGDGLQTRDFTFVANVVRANLLAIASPRRFAGEVVNIASGSSVTLLQLLADLEAVLERRAERRHEPARGGDIRISAADISAARELLAFEPLVSFRDGVRRMLAAPAPARS